MCLRSVGDVYYEVVPHHELRGLFFGGPIECDCLVHRSGFANLDRAGGRERAESG